MHKSIFAAVLFLSGVSFFTGCATAKPDLNQWPAGSDPTTIGQRITDNYLERAYRTNKNGGFIVYPEICGGFGAMKFTDAAGDKVRQQKLITRFVPVLDPKQKILIPTAPHVDFSVFGVVPLEIFLLNGDTNFLALGLAKADAQWVKPLTNGLTAETRWWVDDAWMIGSLQIQAFRATKNGKYADQVTTQLAAYLDKLQETNGLFLHGPSAPFYWARGNGWVAAALAEVLASLPPTHPQYDRLMAGYKKMMVGLKNCQATSGLWHQLLDEPASFEETSGTAMFTYAMIVGVKRGWLSAAEYGEPARRGWLALCEKIDDQGNLREICVGTNKSDSKQFYLDRPRQAGDLHGQSPMLWCAAALLAK
jgi:unsaturated rhamnogalacturonyl hydrolase